MIKKFSLFFSGQVRKHTGRNNFPAGILTAMTFPTRLAINALGNDLLSETEAKSLGGQAWKYLDGSHAESGSVRDAFDKAQRVEGVISFYDEDIIELKISFYERRKKEAFFSMNIFFILSTGEIGGVSCMSPH